MDYTELKPGMYIVMDGQPHLVITSEFLRMQQRKPVVKTKIKNLISGAIHEKNFQPSDRIDEAEIEKMPAKFLYSHRNEFWFAPLETKSLTGFDEANNASKRFLIKEEALGGIRDFLKPNLEATALKFNKEIFNVEIPIKVDYKVIEAPPSIKGNTAQGGTKAVTIETSAKINTPMFIEEGDIIKINTVTGQYVERVEKA